MGRGIEPIHTRKQISQKTKEGQANVNQRNSQGETGGTWQDFFAHIRAFQTEKLHASNF